MWHWTEPLSIQPWALDVKLGLLWQLEILNPAPYYSTNPMVIWKIFQNHLSAHKYQNISWGKPSRRKRRSFIAFGVLSSMLLSIWLRSVIAGSNLHLTYIFPVSLPLQCEQWACVNRNYERGRWRSALSFCHSGPALPGAIIIALWASCAHSFKNSHKVVFNVWKIGI